jgi:hypothetical protein
MFVFNTANITKVEVIKDWYTLTINENFTNGDILEINGETKSVYKNTVKIDYDGIFQRLELGSNPMSINLTGTNSNTTISSSFLIRYS